MSYPQLPKSLCALPFLVCGAGHELQLAEDVFKLQHLLECNILRHREELEEITNAAVKEEQIETKLADIESDWSALNLVGPGAAKSLQSCPCPGQLVPWYFLVDALA
jgi:hypothetical protein